jgi:hypothetical protein
VYVGSFSFFLDNNQITSCITSQTFIALHFLFVSCRSRRGRGWAYAQLRFELDECGKSALLQQSLQIVGTPPNESRSNASAMLPMLESADKSSNIQPVVMSRGSACAGCHWFQRLIQFQKRQLSLCRVFVVPCTNNHNEFAVARRVFDLKCLRPLQRVVQAHPKLYVSFGFWFLAVPSILCGVFLSGLSMSILLAIFAFGMFFMHLGSMSSSRYGLDRLAVKHVSFSFRFAACVALFAEWTALRLRAYYDGTDTFAQIATIFFYFLYLLGQALVFLQTALLDCSPHMATSSQIMISVMAHVPFAVDAWCAPFTS